MEQFTFYELYADILQSMDDVNAGKFAKRICDYEFENAEPADELTDKENFYWSNVSDMLQEVRRPNSQGKSRRNIISAPNILPFTTSITRR